jgi:hypothetical protein
MNLVRAARYAAGCRDRHRPLDGAARFQASIVAQAHKGSCVRRSDVGTDRRWFGESGRIGKPPESFSWIYREETRRCSVNRVSRGG